MAFLPFFHIYGQVVVMLGGLVQGSTLVLFTTPDIEEILEAMERYQASGFYGVPTLFEYLKEYEKTDRVNWKRLKLIACGADTLHRIHGRGLGKTDRDQDPGRLWHDRDHGRQPRHPLRPTQDGAPSGCPCPMSRRPSSSMKGPNLCLSGRWGN